MISLNGGLGNTLVTNLNKLAESAQKLHEDFHRMFDDENIPLVCEIWEANRDGWENQCLSKLFNNDFFWNK